MPLENTRRWPRTMNWRGMKLSPAWNDASRGKSAKLVLAARTRISIVPACSARNMAWPAGVWPNTNLPTCEITVGVPPSYGMAWTRDGEERQAEEHDAQQGAHVDQGVAGVLPRRRPERGHTVADRLDAGHGCAAGAEGLQEDQQTGAHEDRCSTDSASARACRRCCSVGRAGSPVKNRTVPVTRSTPIMTMKK